MKQYYVYIMTNLARTLYIGVTNNLERRVYEHKHHLLPGFTSTYQLSRLAYYEVTSDVQAALAREKQLKGWLRAKKLALVEAMNPQWADFERRLGDRRRGPASGDGFFAALRMTGGGAGRGKWETGGVTQPPATDSSLRSE